MCVRIWENTDHWPVSQEHLSRGLLDADKQGVLSVVFYQKPLAAEALRSQINPLIPEHA